MSKGHSLIFVIIFCDSVYLHCIHFIVYSDGILVRVVIKILSINRDDLNNPFLLKLSFYKLNEIIKILKTIFIKC